MSGDDREEIERKTQALEQASTAILQKMYEQSAGSAPAEGSGSAGAEPKKEEVLDAEFEEVKESDRKKA
jgi:molecular chaperone DnaK